jgi:hypothetical protein
MARLTLQKVLLLDYLEVERTWHWRIARALEWNAQEIWGMVLIGNAGGMDLSSPVNANLCWLSCSPSSI